MSNLNNLSNMVMEPKGTARCCRNYYKARGYRLASGQPNVIARARAVEALFTGHDKVIYHNDRIAGSIRGLFADIPEKENEMARTITESYGERSFLTNADHFAPDYETALKLGIPGILHKIEHAKEVRKNDINRGNFLTAAGITMEAFRSMIKQYAEAAEKSGGAEAATMAEICHALTQRPPQTFREALQLVWLIHVSFVCEGRFAMALGRLDQYLYPFFVNDTRLTHEEASDLLACTFIKIGEHRLMGFDDTVNICIGGVKRDGSGGVNPLSYAVLEAVRRCNIPGPNLSARWYDGAPDSFLDACLEVIGTGLGYPALMNDEVNIPALSRHGYTLEDSRDHCFVGCIENFIPGKQPPWTDGRFNVPKYLELALNNGTCMLTGAPLGTNDRPVEKITCMDELMEAFTWQIEYGAAEYMTNFINCNDKLNRENYQQPYLSCYCQDCIDRGLDINNGGALYPSVHGACAMGIASVADSLAAIHRVIFQEKKAALTALRDALQCNFDGHDVLRQWLLAAPKYGNDDDFVDKYAIWYVEYLDDIFAKYATPDGGPIYIAIASNVQNIPAGLEVAASPDGRLAREPLSDAASPMYGRDKNGPSAVVKSISKPDYTRVSCGTVLNQKFDPAFFSNLEMRRKLASLIEVYFARGGQEIQINAVSKDVLRDAMEHPEQYGGLVVRVSGFSAYFVALDPAVQRDILNRTEH